MVLVMEAQCFLCDVGPNFCLHQALVMRPSHVLEKKVVNQKP